MRKDDWNIEAAIHNKNYSLVINENTQKIITQLIDEFDRCLSFKIIVAFITMSGISLLKTELKKLEKKGIKGKIITGNYQNFTSPQALKILSKFENIELRVLKDENLHMKGYFFEKKDSWNIIIGSSNLTQLALTKNQELNFKIKLSNDDKVLESLFSNFTNFWNRALVVSEFIGEYEKIYNNLQKIKKKYEKEEEAIINQNKENNLLISPNILQNKALKKLEEFRAQKKDKALMILPTGTGKTYLSAFDVKEVQPKKMLYIVHRENIAKKAKDTFKSIIHNKTFGLYTGGKKEVEADYIFCTIQSLKNNIEFFKKTYFDYMIIDEVHHGGARSYQKIFNYFTPKFLLGLTATPQRSDGFNIFEMFDQNIAANITLNEAYKYELLAPFHYFGVNEITIDGKTLDEDKDIYTLTSDQRIENIVSKLKYYGSYITQVAGIIFVSNTKEATILSEKLNEKGFKTKDLSAKDSQGVREAQIKLLEKGKLDYLITVDIFNEGIDIPSINQIVLLRPTQSATVYVQQLGRGLRKYKNKEYVVIIDFIGNYKNNFLIPIALSDDTTYDKDILRDNILSNLSNLVYGSCVINFEDVAQELILKNINKVNFSKKNLIQEDFKLLENRLKTTPRLIDFYNNKLINPVAILKFKKTYIQVKETLDKNLNIRYKTVLENKEMLLFLEYLSQKIIPAKRIEETLIIKYIIKGNYEFNLLNIKNYVKNQGYIVQDMVIQNALNHLAKEIFQNFSMLYKFDKFIVNQNGMYVVNSKFKDFLLNKYFKDEIKDIIGLNEQVFKDRYKKKGQELLEIGQYYSKEEAFKYLLLDYSNGAQVSGYTTIREENKTLIFITLDINSPFAYYNNKFYDDNTFSWFSTPKRKLEDKKGNLTQEGLIARGYMEVEVFVKRKLQEKFIYIGKVKEILNYSIVYNKKNQSMVKYIFRLDKRLSPKLYKSFTTK